MSTTYVYCNSKVEDFLTAVPNCWVVKDFYNKSDTILVLWIEQVNNQFPKIQGIELSFDERGSARVDKTCINGCWNGQSLFEDYLKKKGIECTYTD